MGWFFDEQNASILGLISIVCGMAVVALCVLTSIDRWNEGRTILALLWVTPLFPVIGVFALMWAASQGEVDLIRAIP